MDSRVGTYSDKDGNGFVKPQVTVTGGKLQKNVAHNTRGIGKNHFVYLDIFKNPNTDKAIKSVQDLLKKTPKAKANETK